MDCGELGWLAGWLAYKTRLNFSIDGYRAPQWVQQSERTIFAVIELQ